LRGSFSNYQGAFQARSSIYAQQQKQQFKGTIAALPKLRATDAFGSKDAAIQWSTRPLHI
jgi:hypothetical protein